MFKMKLQIFTFILFLCSVYSKVRIGTVLINLDRHLANVLQNPDGMSDNSIFRDIIQYCRLMIELTKLVEEREDTIHHAAKYLFKHGPPKFLKFEVIDDELKKGLNWNDDDIKNCRYLLRRAEDVWNEFYRTYQRNIVWFI